MTNGATSRSAGRTPDATPASSRWHDIADRADVGLLRTDPAGRVLDMSPAATRMLDRDMDAMRGIELSSLAEPGQRRALQAAFDAVRGGDDAVSRDTRYVRPRGDSISTLSRFSAVRDAGGVLRAITVVLIALGDAHLPSIDTGDTASVELRHAMEALRVSEDRYRRLFESIDQGFCVIEVLFDDGRPFDYRFLEINPAFERYTGLADAVGRTVRELVPAHEDHWFDFYGDIARTGQPARTMLPARALNDRWYEVHAFPFGAPGSHRVAVLFEDISARRRAEQALRDSEERFRCIANVAPSMLWTATANGETTWLSERWSDYTGQPEHISRDQRNRAIHPEDREPTAEAWRRAMKGEEFEVELRLRRHDGEYRWFLVRANPARDDHGNVTGWYGSTTDIHDHKLAEVALREMDTRKDQFLATLAHELRNPLAPLRNCLHILRMADEAEGGNASVDVDRLHGVMDRQVGHLVRLVDDLMEVSRITRGMVPLHVQAVTIAEVVARAVETSRPLLDAAHHVLTVDLPAEPLPMRADPVRLAQVLSNLLNNAAKYTDPGGRVELEARRDGEEVVIVVRDNGLGIATDQIARIFDLFSQAEHSLGRAAGGLGIGLTLVRSLVEMHGGSVIARSGGLGQGSEFEVRLPLHDGDAVDAPHAEEATNARHLQRLRLLVVDDNREHTDSLALYLRMTGHVVRTAYDAASALTWQGAFSPDAVLLDLGMPGVDGYEICRRLRAAEGGERLVIVAITGWGQTEDRHRSEAAGFDAHLVKPVDPAALLSLVDSLLRLKRRG